MLFKEIKSKIVDKYKITPDQLMIIELLILKEYLELEQYYETLKGGYVLAIQNLFRRNYIDLYDINNQNFFDVRNMFLSDKGEKIIEILSGIKIDKQIKIVSSEKDFEEFWNTFPSTDKWENFSATRSLRQDKEGTRKKYNKLISEGVNPTDILDGLKYQIQLFKRNSTLTDNKLTYFQASSTWLHQKTYGEYLNLSKEDSIEDNNSMEVRL